MNFFERRRIKKQIKEINKDTRTVIYGSYGVQAPYEYIPTTEDYVEGTVLTNDRIHVVLFDVPVQLSFGFLNAWETWYHDYNWDNLFLQETLEKWILCQLDFVNLCIEDRTGVKHPNAPMDYNQKDMEDAVATAASCMTDTQLIKKIPLEEMMHNKYYNSEYWIFKMIIKAGKMTEEEAKEKAKDYTDTKMKELHELFDKCLTCNRYSIDEVINHNNKIVADFYKELAIEKE